MDNNNYRLVEIQSNHNRMVEKQTIIKDAMASLPGKIRHFFGDDATFFIEHYDFLSHVPGEPDLDGTMLVIIQKPGLVGIRAYFEYRCAQWWIDPIIYIPSDESEFGVYDIRNAIGHARNIYGELRKWRRNETISR